MLPCLHTFCLNCLSVYLPPESLTITCPLCGQQSILPKRGVSGEWGTGGQGSLRPSWIWFVETSCRITYPCRSSRTEPAHKLRQTVKFCIKPPYMLILWLRDRNEVIRCCDFVILWEFLFWLSRRSRPDWAASRYDVRNFFWIFTPFPLVHIWI